ncbi:MAG: twin-arginine translocase TatA/TatE family subunit [Thermoleophilaceae bacterium]|jgi:sec-independent protein translocase protein TatA|nr:twin-arginine translocase TatA/TatE family subunit [Thermoleophilaceae bacterium]
MPNVGPIEIIVVLLILLVIFGPKRIPELGRSVGQGMRNFKQSVTGRDNGDEPRRLETERTSPEAGTGARTREPDRSGARAREPEVASATPAATPVEEPRRAGPAGETRT